VEGLAQIGRVVGQIGENIAGRETIIGEIDAAIAVQRIGARAIEEKILSRPADERVTSSEDVRHRCGQFIEWRRQKPGERHGDVGDGLVNDRAACIGPAHRGDVAAYLSPLHVERTAEKPRIATIAVLTHDDDGIVLRADRVKFQSKPGRGGRAGNFQVSIDRHNMPQRIEQASRRHSSICKKEIHP